jgi:hypothetical protein
MSENFTALGAYQLYLALKLHFAPGKYDCVKYNYKVKVDAEKFRRMPQAVWFNRLAKRYNKDDLKDAFVSNFVAGKKYGGMFEGADFEDTYTEWRKRNMALGHLFEQDLYKLYEFAVDLSSPMSPHFSEILLPTTTGNKYPIVIRAYLKHNIMPETVVILDRLTKFMSKSDQHINDPLQWPKIRHLFDRYEKVMAPIDNKRFKEILMKVFY